MRALDFGKLSDLQAKYGSTNSLSGMPDGSVVVPSVVFKPQDTKPQLVPLDPSTMLQLMATRKGGLPALYSQPSDVTDIPAGLISKNTLNMKATSTDQLVQILADDNS
jgi:hypothetical protein